MMIWLAAAQLAGVKAGVALAALSAPNALSVAVVAPVVAAAQICLRSRGRALQAFMHTCMSLFLLLHADAWLLLFPAAVFVCTAVQDSVAVPANCSRPWTRNALLGTSAACTALAFIVPVQTSWSLCTQSLPVYIIASVLSVVGASTSECVVSVVFQLLLFHLYAWPPLVVGAVLASGALEFRVACDGLQRTLFALGYKSGTPLEVVLMLLAVAAAVCGVLATPCCMQLLYVLALPVCTLASSTFVIYGNRYTYTGYRMYCSTHN